jgi:phosphatidylglycerophosphatase A
MKIKAAMAIATWFGCGYFPVGPGTAGSLAAVGIAILFRQCFGLQSYWFGILAILMLAPGIWASTIAANVSGRKDPGLVVVDEVIGQWITLSGATVLNWKSWAAAFVLFRVLDIWKPAPARRLESLPGGTGIVMDDVMAGIYGALVLFAAGCFNLY